MTWKGKEGGYLLDLTPRTSRSPTSPKPVPRGPVTGIAGSDLLHGLGASIAVLGRGLECHEHDELVRPSGVEVAGCPAVARAWDFPETASSQVQLREERVEVTQKGREMMKY